MHYNLGAYQRGSALPYIALERYGLRVLAAHPRTGSFFPSTNSPFDPGTLSASRGAFPESGEMRPRREEFSRTLRESSPPARECSRAPGKCSRRGRKSSRTPRERSRGRGERSAGRGDSSLRPTKLRFRAAKPAGATGEWAGGAGELAPDGRAFSLRESSCSLRLTEPSASVGESSGRGAELSPGAAEPSTGTREPAAGVGGLFPGAGERSAGAREHFQSLQEFPLGSGESFVSDEEFYPGAVPRGDMRELWFESGGVRLFAVEDGAGRPIVMLHGPMASYLASLPLIAPLASRYRVVAPDVRGGGKSWSGAPLTFDQLADDVAALLDHIGAEQAVGGGVSGGSGVALRFALRHPGRTAALVLVKPVYAGEGRGYTEEQRKTFTRMDAVASRALDEGVQVLRPLYANLPPPEKALAMLEGFDAASVVATSRFVASGAQPFTSAADLRSLAVPTLLVRGDDALHPAEVSDLYAENIPGCTVVPATADVASEIGAFCDRVLADQHGSL